MPELKEYVNREGITPTDRGTEARVQEGRRVGAFFNQRAESLRDFGNRTAQQIGGAIRDAGDAAVAYQTHRQLNQGIDTYWPIRGGLEDDWNDTVKGNPDKGIPPADPHDPAIAQRFMEEKVKPTLQKWGDTFTTEGAQNWARGRIDSLIGHFQEKTAADMGTVAKQQIDTSLRTMANTATNSAYNDPSPSNVRHIVEDLKASIDGMVGSSRYLKGAEAARANNELSEKYIEQIVKAGYIGDIRKSPNPEKTSAERLKDPLYSKYVSGAEADQISTAAKRQAKENTLTDRAATQAARTEANDAAHAAAAKNMTDNTSVDGNGNVTIGRNFIKNARAISDKFGEDAPQAAAIAESQINWAQHQLTTKKERIVSDAGVKNDLYTRMFSDDSPTTEIEIRKAEVEDKLDRFDAQNLLNLRKAKDDAAGVKMSGPIWNGIIESVKGTLGNDPKGHEAFGKFVSSFMPEYLSRVKAGKSTPNDLNLNDPNSMISQVMEPYKRTPMQHMIDRVGFGLVNSEDVSQMQNAIQQAGGAQPQRRLMKPDDVRMLKNNPSMRGDFDRKFGPGQAEKILGSGGPPLDHGAHGDWRDGR